MMWLVLLLSVSGSTTPATAQQQCSDAVLFQPWNDVWLVRYNKWPCNPNWPWAAFCEDSGWGDEEATVVCREQGFLFGTGGYYPVQTSDVVGYTHVECEGTESSLEQCTAGDPPFRFCSSIGIITQCYTRPQIHISSQLNYLIVPEDEFAEFCVLLMGPLMETVHVVIEANDSSSAVANYDYIPVTYTLSFGPSYQSEQCVEIQIINDSLAEGWERLTVQLTTNSSAIDLATPQFKIYIKPNDADNCDEGSLTLVSGVGRNSLPLVEMYSKGMWSPVCDNNWTVADATVACRELGYQGEAVPSVLESEVIRTTVVPECEGNEDKLTNCLKQLEGSIACQYVLLQCGSSPDEESDIRGPEDSRDEESDIGGPDDSLDEGSDIIGPDDFQDEASDNRSPDVSQDEGSDNIGPDDPQDEVSDSRNPDVSREEGSDNEGSGIDGSGNGDDLAASEASSDGAATHIIIIVVVVEVIAIIVTIILILAIICLRGRAKRVPGTQTTLQPLEMRDGKMEDGSSMHLDNPVYGSGIEQPTPSHVVGEPEHNFINPLYALARDVIPQRAKGVTECEYASVQICHSENGGTEAGGGNSQYENEESYSEDL